VLNLLSVQTRTFSQTFSPTRLIQPDPASPSLADSAQPCGRWTSLDVYGRVAMQKVEGSSPFIRSMEAAPDKPHRFKEKPRRRGLSLRPGGELVVPIVSL
jgi:hypothetical protein